MPRLTRQQQEVWSVYIHPHTGRRSYNDLCRRCAHQCRQSYRATIVECRRYRNKRRSNTDA